MQDKKAGRDTASLRDLLGENPARVKLLQEHGVNWMEEPDRLLAEVIPAIGLDLPEFTEAMDRFDESHGTFKERALKTDLSGWTLGRIIGHIQTNHHFYERKLLMSLDQDLNKILRIHFDDHGPALIRLHDLFADLKKLLEVHYVQEDSLYFPAIQSALTEGRAGPELVADISRLEGEHQRALGILLAIESATDGFTPPADGCSTYQKAFTELKDLAESVFIHFYKESIVLFDAVKRSANS